MANTFEGLKTKKNTMQYSRYLIMRILSIFVICLLVLSCNETVYRGDIYVKPEIVREAPSDFLSPEESMKTFYLPDGYRAELVASEPMINEPVAITWDGNGIMYVAQMETYVQNVDGDGTDELLSRIMRLEDTNGDGKMDKSSVFIDKLLLPRMIMTLEDRLVVNETYSYDLWSYRDTDSDGVADEKERLYHNPKPRGGNLEHQQSGLIWNLDNYVYTTYNPVRFRFSKDEVQVDSLENMPSGQWGLTQDDLGHMYYSMAGNENPAYGFQQAVNYGEANPEGRLSDGFTEPWPIVGTPDVQGGAKKRLKENGTLNHFTGVAGQEIFRGHRLPPDTYGDLFIPEPVGRLIRRAKVENENGKKVLYNAYHETEFMASTDLNFRPIQTKTGPDGSLYIVDMYRGVIQESRWIQEGSLLRPVVLRKNLDKNIGRGRIYRIVHDQIEPDAQPRLLDKTAPELIDYLGHKNGWYRNTAQKLIILKNDTSIIPELKEIARNNESVWTNMFGNKEYALQRVHALWTLEGLGVIDEELIIAKLADEDAGVRISAIRLSDVLLKKGNLKILAHLEKLMEDSDINVVNQLALSLRNSPDSKATDLLDTIKERYEDNEIISMSVTNSLKKGDTDLQKLIKKIAKVPHKKEILNGYGTYNQLCVTCHGKNLMGSITDSGSMTAPPLIGSARVIGDKQTLVKILLNGLVGPIDGEDYGVMMSVGNNSDQWIADIASYIRVMNDESVMSKDDVTTVRRETKDKEGYWTLKELEK